MKMSAKKLTENAEALDFYWKGLARLLEGDEENVNLSVQLFEQALKRDGRFAQALAARAAASLKIYEREWEYDTRWLEQAKNFSVEALTIDDEIALAHRTLGSAYQYERNNVKAVEEIQRALAIEPNDASAYRALSLAYAVRGAFRTAATTSAASLQHDPLNYESYLVLGLTKHLAGIYGEASAAYEQAVAFQPGLAWELIGLLDNALISQTQHERAMSLYEKHMQPQANNYMMLYKIGRANQISGEIQAAQPYFDQVIDLARKELKRNAKSAQAHLYIALAHTRMGRYKEAEDAAKRAVEIAPQDPHILYGMTNMLSMQRRTHTALEWFEKAVSARYSYRGILDLDLMNIRPEPEFARILHTAK